jgi:saccharopine dehydrogenase-like NADP-dependent oxidoreductase
MDSKKLLILGGYGSTGRPLSKLLLQESSVDLVLAGRDKQKAKDLATDLNEQFDGDRVGWKRVDASDPESLREAFSGLDMVIVASSTAEYTEQVAGAALESGIDYFDVLYSTHKLAILQDMAQQIEEADRCFITEGGFHPGLPAALIRHNAKGFDRVD